MEFAMSNDCIEIFFRKGGRVVLRPLLINDYIILMKWINDPEVTQFLFAYLPIMEEDQKEWIESVRKQMSKQIVLMIVVDGVPIGTMGIHNIDHRQGTATTGALIGEKACWGKGYGTEAKMLLLEYAFNTLNLRKIYSEVIAFNKRSYNYSLSCGYKEEGCLKDHHFVKGKYWDKIILSVVKKDFKPLWKKFKRINGKSISV
jgi:RimJ/RimL family protein N-acetyltransferase